MTPQFMLESLRHEQSQLLMLIKQNERLHCLPGGELAHGLALAAATLRDYRDGKIDLNVAIVQYQKVSDITCELGSMLTLEHWKECHSEDEQRANDRVLLWSQRGWIEVRDGLWDLTDVGREHFRFGSPIHSR